jgi:single-stranded-DNA-specific exonuclease
MTGRGKVHLTRRVPVSDDALPASLHPVIRRIYLSRQASHAEDIDLDLARLLPPGQLRGLDEAVALLHAALAQQQAILIVADFDADGATSCALAVRALRAMGAARVDYLVPNRFEYGYGLTPEIVSLAATRHPDLLITVDNGISSNSGVAAARAAGMRVLITDHHLPGNALPDADAIVNPNQPGDEFPSKNLAGVGVIFYVMLALRARLRAEGWFRDRNIPEPNLARLLDLVALGTVADVVPLDRNNRILVSQGLKRINQQQACPGMLALLKVAGRKPGALAASDLGFAVAPRLNAAGRLTDMSVGIECLLTDSESRAQELARELDRLNRERRTIEADMQTQAIDILQKLHLEEGSLPPGLCLFDEGWHQGVIGILAARIRERTHRPVIAFAPANDTEIKGSARSVPGLHIRDALDAVAARHPGLLSRFGGHAMAAGLSLLRGQFDDFRQAFAEEVARHLDTSDLRGEIHTDGELSAGDFTLDLAQQLRDAGPWGQGFPEPLFEGVFDVVERRAVAEKHLKLYLRAEGQPRPIEAIAFRALEGGELPAWPQVRAAYRLDINEYQGTRSVQLIVEHLEAFGE